jgi:hypothetical protein
MPTTPAQAMAPSTKEGTKTVTVLNYMDAEGQSKNEAFTRFSNAVKRQRELLDEGVKFTVDRQEAKVNTQVSISI